MRYWRVSVWYFIFQISPTDWATMALPTAGGRGASGISDLTQLQRSWLPLNLAAGWLALAGGERERRLRQSDGWSLTGGCPCTAATTDCQHWLYSGRQPLPRWTQHSEAGIYLRSPDIQLWSCQTQYLRRREIFLKISNIVTTLPGALITRSSWNTQHRQQTTQSLEVTIDLVISIVRHQTMNLLSWHNLHWRTVRVCQYVSLIRTI